MGLQVKFDRHHHIGEKCESVTGNMKCVCDTRQEGVLLELLEKAVIINSHEIVISDD